MSGVAATGGGTRRREGAAVVPSRLADAFAIQRRVIGALILRELHVRFGRENLGYLWLFLEPMMLGAAISGIHAAAGTGGKVRGVFEFFVVSYTMFFMFRSIFGRSAGALRGSHNLLFHRQVTLLDVLIARNLLELAACIVVMTVCLAGIIMAGGRWPDDPAQMLLAVFLMMLLANGGGVIVAALAATSELVERLVHPITYIMMPISGAFFLVTTLPPQVQEFLLWVPLVHAFELLREGQFGPVYVYRYDIWYLVAWVLGLNLLGLALLRGMRSRIGLE
jgi:capsular polysaccharide transport system permease protein